MNDNPNRTTDFRLNKYGKGGFMAEHADNIHHSHNQQYGCLLYTSPSPRDREKSRMPSSA